MNYRRLSTREIWQDVFNFQKETTTLHKLFASPLLFVFFIFAWLGGMGEEEL